ncbi:MAG TPA: hypothetical protein VLA24_09350 [Pseudomonadales bacterium]|nr:hypothetical protein [Pseudomonadales bacterium]
MLKELPEFTSVDYLHNSRLMIACADIPLRDFVGCGLHIVQYKTVEARRLHSRGVFEVFADRGGVEHHFFVFGDCVLSPPMLIGEIES